jgi:hypothetical protein
MIVPIGCALVILYCLYHIIMVLAGEEGSL